MREDRQLIVIAHRSQLISLITGFGGLIVPLILWLTQRDKVFEMDTHGKNIVNFQISLIIYSLLCIPLIFLCGVGFLGIIAVAIIAIVFPVINGIKASNGEIPVYPLSFKFVN